LLTVVFALAGGIAGKTAVELEFAQQLLLQLPLHPVSLSLDAP